MKAKGIAILGVIVLGLAVLGGCGGHNGQVPPDDDGGGGVIPASFVGQAVCATCHSGPANAYANSPHGKNFHNGTTGNTTDLISGMNGACAPCHTTGFNETGGWRSSAETPHLDNIGCEECHGRGSQHAGAPSGSNITALPQANQTCWDCHVPSYKVLRSGPLAQVNDATFANTAPGKVNPHYRQTPFLLGQGGFERPAQPSPHAQIENTCVTCHLNENSGRYHGSTGLSVDFVACASCHGGEAGAQSLLASFNEDIEEELIAIGGEDPAAPGHPDHGAGGGLLAAYAAANGIDLANNSNPSDPAVKTYKAARYNYLFVLGGRAVHNPEFAREIIEDTRQMLD